MSSPAKPVPSPFRSLLIPTIAAVIGLAILLNLGFWQVRRMAEKEALIAKVDEGVKTPAVPAPEPGEWGDTSALKAADYRHVSVKGHYLPGAAYYYTALGHSKGAYDGPGFLVYSPFTTDAGWRVMINRGFVPQGLVSSDFERLEEAPEGEFELRGLLRKSEKPNWTTPEADREKRIWFARDTDHMADVIGLGTGDLAPFSIDVDHEFTGPGGLPQAGETVVRFKNDHLGYALTWFGLAATLLGVYLTYATTLFRKQDK
ncbi:SURF1 family protein [Roseibium algae]|uniref:SURF1-like protein n=1 Tax=Roseibium algae TaxID=3123038 RepID=A0ABU8TH79_9HYPH